MTCTAAKVSANPPPAPRPLPGFEAVQRLWDGRRRRFVAKLGPGEFYVSRGQELISTVLGSCISACVRDTRLGMGGMNHFMLPEHVDSALGAGTCVDAGLRYGNVAMEHLINGLLAQGASRKRLEVKVFGGAGLMGSGPGIGQRNIDFILEYLGTEGFSVKSKSVGGDAGRKVVYDPSSGKALVKTLRSEDYDEVYRRERAYVSSLSRGVVAGDIELF